MNLFDKYSKFIMHSLFCTSLIYCFLGVLMEYCTNSAYWMLYLKLFLFGLLIQQVSLFDTKVKTMIIAGMILSFSLISFPLIYPFLAGLLIYGLFGLIILKSIDFEPQDSLKWSILPLFCDIFLFIFFKEKTEVINIHALMTIIHTALFIVYLNLNSVSYLHHQDFANNLLFNRVLLILSVGIYGFRIPIYWLTSKAVSILLKVISFILGIFVSIFSKFFMMLGTLMYNLLSLIPMEGNHSNGLEQTVPSAQPDTMDDILQQTQGLSIPSELLAGLALIVFLVLLIWILKKIAGQARRSHSYSATSSEHREWIGAEKKKRADTKRKGLEPSLSKARKNYRNLVNELIKKDYPYLPAMTPLEYLRTLPPDVIDEYNVDHCTSEYLKARYQNNE